MRELFQRAGLKTVDSDGAVTIKGEVRQFFVRETNTYQAEVAVRLTVVSRNGKTLWSGLASGDSEPLRSLLQPRELLRGPLRRRRQHSQFDVAEYAVPGGLVGRLVASRAVAPGALGAQLRAWRELLQYTWSDAQ